MILTRNYITKIQIENDPLLRELKKVTASAEQLLRDMKEKARVVNENQLEFDFDEKK